MCRFYTYPLPTYSWPLGKRLGAFFIILELFHLAQKLVELYPEWCVAWFAVGSYYYLIGKQEFARRYLCKATQLDRVFGPAWLTYGHSFAIENEHDQAMAAYFKACQLMKGCVLFLYQFQYTRTFIKKRCCFKVVCADMDIGQAIRFIPAFFIQVSFATPLHRRRVWTDK